jgi:hypothetical protein
MFSGKLKAEEIARHVECDDLSPPIGRHPVATCHAGNEAVQVFRWLVFAI